VNNLPRVVTQLCSDKDLNPRPVDRKSNVLPVAPPRHRAEYSEVMKYRPHRMHAMRPIDIDVARSVVSVSVGQKRLNRS